MSVTSATEDEQRILALHQAGDHALMSGDLQVLEKIFANDYVQHNESGHSFDRAHDSSVRRYGGC
jgi:hypothetical protein